MKIKKRQIFVTLFLIIFALYAYIAIRGSYLEMLGIGEKYVDIFTRNVKQKIKVFAVSFIVVYLMTYITTKFIKRGLKHFFEEDKKTMPKLPNKSISLAFATVTAIITSMTITQKAVLAFSGRMFWKDDPIFGLDISYYIFQKPFIEAILISLAIVMVILEVYVIVYYVLAFNKFFKKGISMETLKQNTVVKHLSFNLFIIIAIVCTLTILSIQNIVLNKFMTISNNTPLYGAGLLEITVKKWGYIIFAVVIMICAIRFIKRIKEEKYKKALATLTAIPIYLTAMFVIALGVDFIYLKHNELDKQKKHIEDNIEFTKEAYNIKIDEISLENSETITIEEIAKNQTVFENINIFNKQRVITNLQEYQSNLGYYTFSSTQVGVYDIDGKKKLAYITPREIISNDTRTYNNKTYEYTHGYGAIITDASVTSKTGGLNYIKNDFSQTQEPPGISEPRIYFGLETNNIVVTNSEGKLEYDYPLTNTTNSYNVYNGKAGIKLGLIDRTILGIKTGNLKLAISKDMNKDSNILIKRNIIERAKTVMPYLKYDEEPYMVITDNGKLMWVLDAYTTSDSYPYSQMTTIQKWNGQSEKLNYIRNSVKVIIDSYDGTMKFYITDWTDPIIMAYWNMYPSLFEDKGAKIPEDIAKHFVYPKYLYNVQKDILKQYHNVQPEVLYRADDVWDIAKENTTKVSSLLGTNIEAYYTMVKTKDSDEVELGLVVPYTIVNKQNINAYLVGTCDANGEKRLRLYRFNTEEPILGTLQLDALVEQDATISKELESIEVTGTKIEKNIIVVPINNTLIYIEPIYQVLQNENQNAPILKKVVAASGNKVAIGNDVQEALKNLVSQAAVSIKIDATNIDALLEDIVEANENLKQSNKSNDWQLIGRDIERLQNLIDQLNKLLEEQELSKKNT